jgi:hypothetical protein
VVSRREFDVLARRVDQIDANGPRGIGALQQLVSGLVAQVAELKGELAKHESSHDANSRWAIGQVIALAAVVVALLALILTR